MDALIIAEGFFLGFFHSLERRYVVWKLGRSIERAKDGGPWRLEDPRFHIWHYWL